MYSYLKQIVLRIGWVFIVYSCIFKYLATQKVANKKGGISWIY